MGIFEKKFTLELLSYNHGRAKLPLDWEKLHVHMTFKFAYLIKNVQYIWKLDPKYS